MKLLTLSLTLSMLFAVGCATAPESSTSQSANVSTDSTQGDREPASEDETVGQRPSICATQLCRSR